MSHSRAIMKQKQTILLINNAIKVRFFEVQVSCSEAKLTRRSNKMSRNVWKRPCEHGRRADITKTYLFKYTENFTKKK